MVLPGVVVNGCGHFRGRINCYPAVFEQAVGYALYPGTINVRVDRCLPIVEQFRIAGTLIAEPDQDLLFERCRINGVDAVRIRPYQINSGEGGHGDNILEISSGCMVEGVELGAEVEVELFREID